MQDYAARTITPLNKKVLGAGLVLLFLLGFIANLTDFLLPMVFSVMGKAAITVSMLFWACAFLWSICPRACTTSILRPSFSL